MPAPLAHAGCPQTLAALHQLQHAADTAAATSAWSQPGTGCSSGAWIGAPLLPLPKVVFCKLGAGSGFVSWSSGAPSFAPQTGAQVAGAAPVDTADAAGMTEGPTAGAGDVAGDVAAGAGAAASAEQPFLVRAAAKCPSQPLNTGTSWSTISPAQDPAPDAAPAIADAPPPKPVAPGSATAVSRGSAMGSSICTGMVWISFASCPIAVTLCCRLWGCAHAEHATPT